jgi:hypothetical protein
LDPSALNFSKCNWCKVIFSPPTPHPQGTEVNSLQYLEEGRPLMVPYSPLIDTCTETLSRFFRWWNLWGHSWLSFCSLILPSQLQIQTESLYLSDTKTEWKQVFFSVLENKFCNGPNLLSFYMQWLKRKFGRFLEGSQYHAFIYC